MTNYEMLMDMPQEEMAWFLMNRVTCDECMCCVYRYIKEQFEECYKAKEDEERPLDDWTCIEGHLKWLQREPTAQDLKMFYTCKNNVVIGQHISMSNENKRRWEVVYGNAAGDMKYASEFKESEYAKYMEKIKNEQV